MKIDIWVPDFAGATGGIQTFSYFLVRGTKDCFPNADIAVFAKSDASAPPAEDLKVARFYSTGTWPARQRTVAFSLMLLANALRRRPDLIIIAHINFAPVAYFVRAILGIPYVVVGHGVESWREPSLHIGLALRKASKLWAVSRYTRDRMSEVLKIPTDRIAVLPNTFDPDSFTPGPKPRFLLKRYGLRRDQPVVLTIARLASAERYKGYDQVLKALVRVREKLPSACYLLGGEGPDRSRIVNLIQQLNLENNVILAGYIQDEELSAHYNLCDVFAMPSKGEGFGIVFLEALACGKPVVAGNADGSTDALLDGRLGMLVDPDDVEQIADALIASLEQRAKSKGGRTRSGESKLIYEPEELRREVIEAFGYQRFKERLAEIVKPLIAGQRGKSEEVTLSG